MRPIDKTTARYHTDLWEERYHVDGRSKRLTKRFAKRKSSKAYRRALETSPFHAPDRAGDAEGTTAAS